MAQSSAQGAAPKPRRKRTVFTVDEAALDAAIAKVLLSTDAKVNKSAVARRHGVPLGTLRSRLGGHSSHRQGAQALLALPSSAEKSILDYLTWRFNKGDPATKWEAEDAARQIAQLYAVPCNDSSRSGLGKQWFGRFIKRYPQVGEKGILKASPRGRQSQVESEVGDGAQDEEVEDMDVSMAGSAAAVAPPVAPAPTKRSRKK